ncbi:MAG: branched-chain amino acid transaminase [Nitrososphaeria archaeon]
MKVPEAKYIWLDGRLVPWAQATTHLMTHSLHYGTAVFEGIRGYSSAPGGGGELNVFRLMDHMRRLEASAKIYGFPLRYSPEELASATLELLRANELHEDVYIRPLSYLGYGTIGLVFSDIEPHVAIIAFPYGKYFHKDGLNVMVSTWRRICQEATPPAAKVSGHYVNSVLAKMEALRHGFDDALMLDSRGYLSEATGENVFLVRGGTLVTPPPSAGILEGITRDTLIRLAREEGIPVEVRDVSRHELYVADEVFLAGTAAEVTPVLSVDGRTVGSGRPGPVTSRLRALYESVARGSDPRHPEWRTPVYGRGT